MSINPCEAAQHTLEKASIDESVRQSQLNSENSTKLLVDTELTSIMESMDATALALIQGYITSINSALEDMVANSEDALATATENVMAAQSLVDNECT